MLLLILLVRVYEYKNNWFVSVTFPDLAVEIRTTCVLVSPTWWPAKKWGAWFHDGRHEDWRGVPISFGAQRTSCQWCQSTLRRRTTRSYLLLTSHLCSLNSPQAGKSNCTDQSARSSSPFGTATDWEGFGRGCRWSWAAWCHMVDDASWRQGRRTRRRRCRACRVQAPAKARPWGANYPPWWNVDLSNQAIWGWSQGLVLGESLCNAPGVSQIVVNLLPHVCRIARRCHGWCVNLRLAAQFVK